MKKELGYYNIGASYGSCQDWFKDYMMNKGGCGAVTACDVCIYLAKYKNMKYLYPFNPENVSKKDFIEFAEIMKPFLSPRRNGIDTLQLFIDGFDLYLKTLKENKILMYPLQGNESFQTAKDSLIKSMDNGMPIAYLLLLHNEKEFDFYEWHWFILNGYKEDKNKFFVKAVTYGAYKWLDFEKLWNTGHEKKGGMVLFECNGNI